MILKRPYAFFIKNFKLLHFIIFTLASILTYKTALIYSFMKEYCAGTSKIVGKNVTSELFSPLLFILIGLLIIVNVIIIIVMIRKQKPLMYYIINITLYIAVLTVYILSHSIISDLQVILVSAKKTLAIRDILNIARILQIISTVFYLVRATGFDIKKFDFVKDLQSLDITEEDNEEIEVALEVETNEIIREIKRTTRNAKYYYKENKFIINIVLALFISFTSLLIYLSTSKYNKVYKENDFFNAGTLTLGIKETNIVTKDYKNQTLSLDGYSLVIVKISVSSKASEMLQESRAALVVNKKQYYNTNNYKDKIIDLGNPYNDENLTNEFKDYILTYKIPTEDIDSKMIFRYIDKIEYKRGKTIVNSIDVKLDPKKIDEQTTEIQTYELTNQIDLSKTTMGGYKLNINSYEIADKFENEYNSCISKTECYNFKEILLPSVTRNRNKALLKIEGNISYEYTIGKITNLYDFIEKFGTIEYTYNGEEYKETNDFSQINPKRTSKDGIYYIEVNEEIKNSERIKLILNLRNKKYEYILKGEY